MSLFMRVTRCWDGTGSREKIFEEKEMDGVFGLVLLAAGVWWIVGFTIYFLAHWLDIGRYRRVFVAMDTRRWIGLDWIYGRF